MLMTTWSGCSNAEWSSDLVSPQAISCRTTNGNQRKAAAATCSVRPVRSGHLYAMTQGGADFSGRYKPHIPT